MKSILFISVLFMTVFAAKAQLVPEDKALHFGAGALIGAGTTGIVYELTGNKKKAVIYGIGLSTLAGITKEIIDHNNGSRADGGDMLATTLGGAVGSFSVKIILDSGKRRKHRIR